MISWGVNSILIPHFSELFQSRVCETPEETGQRGAMSASNIPAHPSYRPKVRSAWSHTGQGQWSVREERQVLLLPTWPQPAGSTLGLARLFEAWANPSVLITTQLICNDIPFPESVWTHRKYFDYFPRDMLMRLFEQ